mgnify:CR=1 FL=1
MSVEGPIELPALVDRIKAGQVMAQTWVYSGRDAAWHRASEVPELQMFFSAPASGGPPVTMPIEPGVLRRVRVLAALTDDQLVRFASFMELVAVPQWQPVVRQGERGDAMFLILEGELRVRLLIGDRETLLATLRPGDFFGEMTLFDHGPRSADVVANEESTLLKISAAACQALARQAPDIATAFLFGIGKTVAARMRADNRRLRESESLAYALSM